MTENHFLENNLCLSVFLFVFICVFVPTGSRAAILYLDSSGAEYQPGDTFAATLRIDNESECVNAVEVNLKFPQDVLEAVDFQDGESILVFWVKRPEIKNDEGTISFIGGVPGGYCGKLHPNSGFTDILGKAIFRIRGTDPAQIPSELYGTGAEQIRGTDPEADTSHRYGTGAELNFFDSKVLVNDGIGTEAIVATKNLKFGIQDLRRDKSVDAELYASHSFDIEPPEPFSIELTKDILPPASEFKNSDTRINADINADKRGYAQQEKYFAVFQTSDKQSGIDHFKIAETRGTPKQSLWDAAGQALRKTTQKEEWKIVQDPYYLLEYQDLQSIIKVKAVDKAGNERIVEYGFVNACSTLMLI